MKAFLHKLHKWVSLTIGLQVALWLSSGIMMAQLDADKVSGEKWARQVVPVAHTLTDDELLEPHQLPAQQLKDALGIELEMNLGQPVYRVRQADGVVLLNAIDGSVITFGQQYAERIAKSDFTGKGDIVASQSGNAPDMETRDSVGPYWRVNFSDSANTSIYISVADGQILERRNRSWRIFDFFWMLHIMDYSARTDFNNTLIIGVALTAIWLGISGFILLFSSFGRRDFDFLGRLQRRLKSPS